MPIETAPDDGSEVLLFGNGVVIDGGYLYGKGRHVGWAQYSRRGTLYWSTRDPSVNCAATHWQPLPKPPISQSRASSPSPGSGTPERAADASEQPEPVEPLAGSGANSGGAL